MLVKRVAAMTKHECNSSLEKLLVFLPSLQQKVTHSGLAHGLLKGFAITTMLAALIVNQLNVDVDAMTVLSLEYFRHGRDCESKTAGPHLRQQSQAEKESGMHMEPLADPIINNIFSADWHGGCVPPYPFGASPQHWSPPHQFNNP
jgi:hypothetical protein